MQETLKGSIWVIAFTEKQQDGFSTRLSCESYDQLFRFSMNVSYISLTIFKDLLWYNCFFLKCLCHVDDILLRFPQLQFYSCTQFGLFRLNAAYSSVVSYWGNKASRQHSPLFHLQPTPLEGICLSEYIGLSLSHTYQLWH